MAKSKLTVIDRFMQFVSPEPNSGCWLWLANVNCDRKPYGRFKIGMRQYVAHRVSYELYVGPIPEGLQLDHLCRVMCCVNPQHLEPVTNTENCRRGQAVRKKKTHCPQGHDFTPENTRIAGNGWWLCIKCCNQRCRDYYYSRKAKIKAERRS